jgi:hypothetical protein
VTEIFRSLTADLERIPATIRIGRIVEVAGGVLNVAGL